ncbi:hypothetical protein FRC04_011448 [Tulasnella sp. 424]|nr:hypothetical protein FRC04_011448 [Tulasnella sp. 424]
MDFKRTKVVMRDYEWGPGWGLELAESATKEEFIDGEVIGEIEADFRSLEAEYLDRNYMFGLDKARSIDSARASNETRVINHAGDKKENLVAEVRFVDEEPRIAFFAGRRIEPGEELFFNYGQEFFGKSKASGSRGKKK